MQDYGLVVEGDTQFGGFIEPDEFSTMKFMCELPKTLKVEVTILVVSGFLRYRERQCRVVQKFHDPHIQDTEGRSSLG